MSSMIYDLNGIPVQIEYRRIKNINLYIRPPAGEVLVTAPKGTPSGRIKKFVDSKEEWIRLHQEKMRVQAGKGEAGQPTKGQIEKMKKTGTAICEKVGAGYGSTRFRVDL